ncbi:AT-hook motif nuclear-localized protein 5-like, partial [Pistacia vera]|uniref:AT-hook motif nuclear-localized protein 5-like n=1 Tax=Pistacia vera TaxID=55513 RepID=UPI00126314E8
GRFEILCLSGSYLIAEDGGPRNRTGGVSASLSSPDGHVFGGGVAVLIAASIVQVVVCSFVYGGSKTKNKQIAMPESDMNSTPQLSNKSATPIRAPVSQNFSSPAINVWPGSRLVDLRNPHTDIDLTR